MQHTIDVSMLEIYNEKIRDLFGLRRSPTPAGRSVARVVFVSCCNEELRAFALCHRSTKLDEQADEFLALRLLLMNHTHLRTRTHERTHACAHTQLCRAIQRHCQGFLRVGTWLYVEGTHVMGCSPYPTNPDSAGGAVQAAPFAGLLR